MKYYPAYDFEKTVWGISVQNVNMLLAVIPEYRSGEKEKENDSATFHDEGMAKEEGIDGFAGSANLFA